METMDKVEPDVPPRWMNDFEEDIQLHCFQHTAGIGTSMPSLTDDLRLYFSFLPAFVPHMFNLIMQKHAPHSKTATIIKPRNVLLAMRCETRTFRPWRWSARNRKLISHSPQWQHLCRCLRRINGATLKLIDRMDSEELSQSEVDIFYLGNRASFDTTSY